jgi:hypothetical protein
MERRAHAIPQPASMEGDVPRTLFTNWCCRGKRVALLVRAGPSLHAVLWTGPLPNLPSKPGRIAHSAPAAWQIRDIVPPGGRPNPPNVIDQTRRIHGCKKYCACSPVSRKREIFHDRRLSDWFCWNSFGKLESGTPRFGERASQLARRSRRTGSYDNKTDREVRERDFTGN